MEDNVHYVPLCVDNKDTNKIQQRVLMSFNTDMPFWVFDPSHLDEEDRCAKEQSDKIKQKAEQSE
jgi:hypothetical protein